MTLDPTAPECAPTDREATWLPCPFCGSHNHSADKMEADDDYLRSCNDCGGRTAYYRTMEEADAAWNKPRYVAPAHPPQPVLGDEVSEDVVERVARELHAIHCDDSDQDRIREGLPPVEKWADPWHPCSSRQLAKLKSEATRLARAALFTVPQSIDDGEACTDCEDSGITIQTERYCSCAAGLALRAAHPPQPGGPEVVECVSLEEGMPHGERFAVIGWTGFDQAVVREERDGCLLVFNPEDFVRVTAPRRAAAILRGEPDPAGGG